MKYAIFDEKGLPKGFFDPTIHKSIPKDAVGISDEVWKKLLTGKYAYLNGALVEITGKIWDEKKKVWREKTKKEKLEEYKQNKIAGLNRRTKEYIAKILKNLDWGDTYEETLSELQNSALNTETRILYFLGRKIADITLTQIREKIALYLAGQYTTEDLQKELEKKGFTQEGIEKFLPLFAEAAEVASLIYWTEEVWKKEEELEKAIEEANSIEEIDQLMSSIQFPPPPGGEG